MVQTGQMPDPQTLTQDKPFILVSIGSTFPAHLLTLLLCWFVVTSAGKRPFLQTLGWGWSPQFKWVHAVGLAFLMMGVAIASEKLLPHHETDLEQLLKLGYSVRVMVALLAVLTAPLVEELVYRGVLYMGIERDWGKRAGVIAATLLFALVHVPQYRQSIAAITAILSLSLALTLVRAWTGKLLPCVATHLVYNGVQAAALLFASGDTTNNPQTQAALIAIWRSLGFN
jgi:membrane protease YdiL (CAAX protease family)